MNDQAFTPAPEPTPVPTPVKRRSSGNRWTNVLIVAAVLYGLAFALSITRPLRRLAAAARRMTAGDRSLAVVPAGPAEVADVADALGSLSTALAASEGQRHVVDTPFGPPSDAIIEAAKKGKCDLIVMASHGRRGSITW